MSWNLVRNDSAETAPSEGLIEIVDAENNPKILAGRKPTAPGITRAGALPYAIAAGEVGPVYLIGAHRVTVTLRPGQILKASKGGHYGDRVGTWYDSWTAWKCPIGPWMVYHVDGATENTTGANLTTVATVRYIGERGEGMYIEKAYDDDSHDICHVLRIPNEWTMEKLKPGVILIESPAGEVSLP